MCQNGAHFFCFHILGSDAQAYQIFILQKVNKNENYNDKAFTLKVLIYMSCNFFSRIMFLN